MDPEYYAMNLTQAKCEDNHKLVYKKHLKSEIVTKKKIVVTGAGCADVNGTY
jgi:hypothetical protein